MGGDVYVVVTEFGSFVMETIFIGEQFLEGGSVDFIGDWLAVYGVLDRGILDFERSVGVEVKVEAAGCSDGCFGYGVAYSVGVEVGTWHGVGFIVDDAVDGAIDHRVYAEGEDVLVVGGEDSGVDDCSEWNRDAFVDWLG